METDVFAGKRVTVLGLGLLGRGAGDAAFIAERAKEVIVTDRKSEGELAASVEKLRAYGNVTFHLGGHKKEDFTDTDMVIKAAGVRLDSPEIAAAKQAGVPVYMSTAVFAKTVREGAGAIVGVTGTRGKSTVAHMIFHALARAGRRAHLGGNIRGVSTLSLLPAVQKGDICVLELDSWQLQGFGDFSISPQIAVMTNLMPDHQDYYPNDEAYFSDKANIFRYQKAGDALIVGRGIAERVQAAHPPRAADVPPAIPDEWRLLLKGAHNRENAALAAAALRALGLAEEEIRGGLESFAGVEGRLQFVREVNGVQIYNDNNATTPEATIAAIRALSADRQGLSGEKNISLIMGGSDKGLDMSGLLQAILDTGTDVYFLAGTGTERLRKEAPQVPVFDSLESAVQAALDGAKEGSVILFSPAFASFGMFKNEYDRNDRFLRIINQL